MEPKKIVDSIERSGKLPSGTEERFLGYGVMGLPFKSGHVLAMRRFPVNSIGGAYTSVWHRNPEGEWTFIQDVKPERACSRYFGSAVERSLQKEIRVHWTGPYDFTVAVEEVYPVRWQVSLEQTTKTEIMNSIGSHIPESLWRNESILQLVGKIGSNFLDGGQLRLTGRVPNGQKFLANPRYVWMISSSTAKVAGEDLGEIGPLPEQVRLGDLWIPQSGRFFIGSAFLEAFDSARHVSHTSKAA